jgi:transposase-like protein
MDTSQQAAVVAKDRDSAVALKRQRRSIAEKRRIVEETLAEGASVARVARAQGVPGCRSTKGRAAFAS